MRAAGKTDGSHVRGLRVFAEPQRKKVEDGELAVEQVALHEASTYTHAPAVDGARTASKTARAVTAELAKISPEQLDQIVKKKAICPFIGSAIATGALPIRNTADKPLASIEDVVKLGNLGGGDLGKVFRLFATGNHAKMAGLDPNKLTEDVPEGMFSLDLAGSQGSHPGSSRLLSEHPQEVNSGEFSPKNWQRLVGYSKNGYITEKDFGRFIAENVRTDKKSKIFDTKLFAEVGKDVLQMVADAAPAAVQALKNVFRTHDQHGAERKEVEDFTRLLGAENVAGSAGEFGLLFALLKNSPRTKTIDGHTALSMKDVQLLFRYKMFPRGWEKWPKEQLEWGAASGRITVAAAAALVKSPKEREPEGII